ncbi:MAG: pyridoxamine 5'-phosphate oxidase family protein [Actinomycetota bacterium]
MDPIVEPLALPEGYGTATTPLAWEVVRRRLEEPLNYWLSTTRPDGRPHAVPSDGVWFADTWYFGGAPETVHMRNLTTNPRAVLHLGDGSWAVIVEGRARPAEVNEALARSIAAAGAKYEPLGYAPTPQEYTGGRAWALEATSVMAWTVYPTDATRFRFPR